jgi:beta-glucanase (GH16 family)
MKIHRILIVLLITVFISCSKAQSPAPQDNAPTGLTIKAIPSVDNSGNVSFEAKAENAVDYEYDFGNGIYKSVSTGIITYKYPQGGNYTVTVLAKSAGGKIASESIKVTVSVGLALIWSDEFNTAGSPDASKWGYDLGTGSGGWGNQEAQYYTNRTDNVVVSNGTLKIIAKSESYSGSNYTSARMLTKGKFSFQYGRVEVRAKLPVGGGTWPAIWALGEDISSVGWPSCGEIDIMEHLGNSLNKVYFTLHYPGHSGGNATGTNAMIPNVTSEFKVYSIEWTAESIVFFVDGVKYYTFPNNSSIPYNKKFFLILNIAMGGNFGGAIDPAFKSGTMEIDYVRVYQ